MSLYLIWNLGNSVLRGQVNGQEVDGALVFPVGFPGEPSEAKRITLRSSAREEQVFESLQSVSLYLTGADTVLVQEQWPYLGDLYSPTRPELNGGFEISFDGGRNFTRFDKSVGLESNPDTWLILPAIAIGTQGSDGVLGPFDQATMTVRYRVPPGASDFVRTLDVQLAISVDPV